MHSHAPARVAVITAYHKETPAQLLRCAQSVMAQTFPCTHFLISDGYPSDFIAALPIRHVQLGVEHRDFGDTPRAVGSMLAIREGFDAIVHLDADNYYLPEHIAGLVQAWESQQRRLDVIRCNRFFLRPDGSRLPLRDDPDPWRQCDTSCMFLANRALAVTPLWSLMPDAFHGFGDRVFWLALKARGLEMGPLDADTVGYTTRWAVNYTAVGEPPPDDAKDAGPFVTAAAQWWLSLDAPARQRQIALLGYDPTAVFAELHGQRAA